MKNKALRNLILSCALLLIIIVGVVLNGIFGIVRPFKKIDGEYITATSNGVDILGADANGKIIKTSDGATVATLPSKPLFWEASGENIYVACENRIIYRLFNGKIVASREINYKPTALEVSDGKVLVGGTIASDRNKLYCFDAESLNYIDLSPNEEHSEKGESESELVYLERIYAMTQTAPVIGVNLEQNKILVVTAYGGVATYDLDGKQIARKGTKFNFSYVDFSKDGTAWIADDNGGVLAFTPELVQKEYCKISDSFIGIVALEDGVAVANRAGLLFKLDENLQQESRVNFKVKSYGLYADDTCVSIISSQGRLAFYNWKDLPRYHWMSALEVILVILAIFAVIPVVFSAIKLKSLSAYKQTVTKVKQTGLKLFRSKKCYLLLIPTLLIAIVFAYYPAIKGFILAFFDVELGGVNTFCGFDNFKELLSKTYFWSGMKNMLLFLVTDIIKGLIPAFIFAELIIAMRSKRCQYLTRVLLYLPGVIPGVAMLLIWQSGIFGMDGLINSVIGSFGFAPKPWLGHESTAMASLIFFGFPWVGSYIILYGSLMGIPPSFYEAAKLDGCSWWRRMVSIDLPMISPQLKYIFVTCFIGSVQDFQRIYMTTEGAHGTYIPMLELYYNLTTFNNLGVAATMGLLLFAVLMVATLINLKVKTVDSYE